MRTLFRRAAGPPLALVSTLLLWVGAVGCEPPASVVEERGAVRGVVTNGLDDEPIARARVRARGHLTEAYTDENGRFVLELPAGRHRLWLAHPAFVGGQFANVHVRAQSETQVEPQLFPRSPTEADVRAYFARQPPRRHAHPAHERAADGGDDVGAIRAAGGDPGALPATIRVWRSNGTPLQPTRSNGWADRSCDPEAEVLELPREEYVKGVIPHEWIPSWHPEALRAGAIAARTYAVSWWRRGGRWDCADVDDGTVTQVYRDSRSDATNAAVDETAGQVVMRDGEIITTEYSAENGDPTAFGVAEPTCTGEELFGHGRGMCQWGTQRWATASCANPPCDWGTFGEDARDHVWMVEHYYPDACVAGDPSTLPPCAVIPAEGGTLDDSGPCFALFGPAQYWREESEGFGGGLRWTNAFEASAPSNWARWRLHFAAAGTYRVEAWIDGTWGVYERARYEVDDETGTAARRIDQGSANGWTELGVFEFLEVGEIRLLDHEDGPVAADQHIVADAIRITPVRPSADAGAPTPEVDAGGTQIARQLGDGPRRVGPASGLSGCSAHGTRTDRGTTLPFGGLLVLASLLIRRRR